jgi:hypothetical protein
MVPAVRLRITRADVVASEFAADRAVAGIVLEQAEGRIGAVEAEDVAFQRRAWAENDLRALRMAHAFTR